MLAAVGILTDSAILIVGAMVVGPEFGPLAALCVAIVAGGARSRDAPRSRSSSGFPLAIAAAVRADRDALRAADLGPDAAALEDRAADLLHLASRHVLGARRPARRPAGMLSLSTAKSGALIGVLISVTTIPAAANIGVAAAYRNWDECRGAALQLVINLRAIVVAGVVTLGVERAAFRRRRSARRERADQVSD